MSKEIIAQQHLISDIKTRVLRIAFDLVDDELYTKDEAISDLGKLAQMLDENYPRYPGRS
jgi:hypothetical protein